MCTKVLGKKTRKHKEWITPDTWNHYREEELKRPNHPDTSNRGKTRTTSSILGEEQRSEKSARKDKRAYIEELTTEAETAEDQRNMKRLYEITRTLSGKNSKPSRPVKDENGNAISGEEEQRARWAEHFKETLNRPAPPDIPPPSELIDVNINPSLKSGKAAGPDGISPEALKIDVQTSTDMLHPLLSKIWEQEKVPED